MIINADARRIPLADASVHCVVTSPPYWGLRDYKVKGQIGLEPTVAEYVAEMVAVFREVRRVLRPDGVCWLNLGDSYNAFNGGAGPSSGIESPDSPRTTERPKLTTGHGLNCKGLPAGCLIGIPWRVALALVDDGWILRAENIWAKRSPMPESVKTRPTRAHEQVFLLAKTNRYFYDWFSVLEKASRNPVTAARRDRTDNGTVGAMGLRGHLNGQSGTGWNADAKTDTRNLRSVWSLSSEPFPGAHFATFPRKLVIPLIKAGTSERGCCPKCGAQWIRETKKERVATRPGLSSKIYIDPPVHRDSPVRAHAGDVCGNRDPGRHVTRYITTGWRPGCACGIAEIVPPVVFDPFGGAGTVPLVAESLGRIGLATELSADYCRMALDRIHRPHQPVVKKGREEYHPLFSEKP